MTELVFSTIVWQPPDPMKIPLYYVANWGVTQVQVHFAVDK